MDGESLNEKSDFSNADSFEDFKYLALNRHLSKFEKIGFPDEYRKGLEEFICNDIATKLLLTSKTGQKILDVGSGCSELPELMSNLALNYNHRLSLMDSKEMLANLPTHVLDKTTQVVARFPDCKDFIRGNLQSFDSVVCYSVIQYVFNESSIFDFLDALLSLLKPNGRALIGDVPNISMKKRFMSSESGIKFHNDFFGNSPNPNIEWNQIERSKIDDSVMISILMRARSSGFHAFLLPQAENLPLSNRREDILIVRP